MAQVDLELLDPGELPSPASKVAGACTHSIMPVSMAVFVWFLTFEIGNCFAAQGGPKLANLLPWPSESDSGHRLF